MPNPEQMRKAAERREARRTARDTHAAQADAEAVTLSQKSEAQSQPDYVAPARVAAPAKSRKERVAAQHRAAEVQADVDAAVTACAPDVDAALETARQGGTLPLHVLNALAKEADDNLRDEARQIGSAAGKAAMDAANVLRPERSRHKRFNRVRRANDLLKAETKTE